MWRRVSGGASSPALLRGCGLAPRTRPPLEAAARPSPVVHARFFGDRSGTVKFFNPERGFGFIVSEGQDFFVHYTNIEPAGGFRSLGDGEEVEFDVEEDHTGKQRAVRVTGPAGSPVKGSSRQREEFGDGQSRY
mmetsp:Transcript_76475/g.216196  ORF Transcript_76475/g.216196 Transcript_76475/m.216196 type:complete len:134 (+) Transcript_76475:88-489(+)